MSLLAVRGGASRRGAGPLWCGAPPLSSYWGTNMTHDPAQRPVRVLVVDDHADVRFLLHAILEDAGPDVAFAGEAGSDDQHVVGGHGGGVYSRYGPGRLAGPRAGFGTARRRSRHIGGRT